MLEKIPKISLDHCQLDLIGIIESCKNFQPFSCYNFESKNGRFPVTPLRAQGDNIAENNSEIFIDHKLLDAERI